MKIKQTINDIKKWIILILIAILSYWFINNIGKIIIFFKTLYNVLFPFIFGGIIAFILNIPMRNIEKLLNNKTKLGKDIKRIISIIISLFLFILVVVFISFLLVPELINNIEVLISNIPDLFNKTENYILELLNKFPDIQKQISDFFNNIGNLSNILTNILNYILNGIVELLSNIVLGIFSIFTSIIFAIYMLSQKEELVSNSKKIVYALFNKKNADKCIEIGKMSNKIFSKFISGQCLEAVILGTIFFVVLSIFRFPYALIISVLTCITALIPIFGALIAMVIGAILIGITNPLQSLFFVIIYLIIQQIEGNFIYPKVVGKSVGLSPLWTLLAVTVGGSLFGIAGMLIGLPLASIIYVLIKEYINNKLKIKKIVIE